MVRNPGRPSADSPGGDGDLLRRWRSPSCSDEQSYRDLFEHVPIGLYRSTPDGRLLDVNPALVQMLRYPDRSTLLARNALDLYARPGDRLRWQSLMEQQGRVLGFETELRCYDGSVITVRESTHVVRNDRGQPLYYEGSLEDITALKQFEVALRTSERQYRTLFQAMPVAIFLLDREARITEVNPAFVTTFQGSEHDWKDQKWTVLYPDVPEHKLNRLLHRVQNGTRVHAYRLPARRRDGKKVHTEMTLVAFDQGERGPGYLGIVHDITRRIRAERRIRAMVRELERSNRELEQFAYIASHDLQEPLRMVISFTQLLQRRCQGKMDREAMEFMQFILDGAQRMQQLLEGLLQYARVGTRSLRMEPVPVESVVQVALQNLHMLIQESGAVITWDPLPTVRGDAQQLVQLFQNLIGNAIKFRSEAPPRIHISARRRGDEWVFTVRDNGIGIPPDQKERIFQIFQRMHTREEYPGLGIGLALCKKIVERHGGHIDVDSVPGQGATFLFTLPAHDADPPCEGQTCDP